MGKKAEKKEQVARETKLKNAKEARQGQVTRAEQELREKIGSNRTILPRDR